MKVFLVDDSTIVRERVASMLSEHSEIEIIGQAQRVKQAIDLIGRLKPDVVVLDIRLSGGSGIDVLRDIKKLRPTPLVIMLTNLPYRQYRQECMNAGADFFFDKSTEFTKLDELFEKLIGESGGRISTAGETPT